MVLRSDPFKDDSGSTAVEFALVAVPALFFLLGSIEISRLLWTYTALQESVAQAARCAGLETPACSTVDGVKAFVRDDASSRGINLSFDIIQVVSSSPDEGSPSEVEISVRFPFNNALPFFNGRLIDVSANFPIQPEQE